MDVALSPKSSPRREPASYLETTHGLPSLRPTISCLPRGNTHELHGSPHNDCCTTYEAPMTCDSSAESSSTTTASPSVQVLET
ncbi:hypothetical protein G6O67_003673 [Ophiocordyceps sinensis]|uniref:Uncharacterized protein n=1 Tax=Ophiocordyceps sinensis TaxID=72228 RepID=A0A8H4PSE6_9HYPO|nr:hypothetical protein G6O67_003673 [Ophiocordyceps sinensis]